MLLSGTLIYIQAIGFFVLLSGTIIYIQAIGFVVLLSGTLIYISASFYQRASGSEES